MDIKTNKISISNNNKSFVEYSSEAKEMDRI